MKRQAIILSGAGLIILMLLPMTAHATVAPITSVDAGVNGSPPYMLQSITVGSFHVTVEDLITGTSEGTGVEGMDISNADNFDLHSFAGRTPQTGPNWRITQIGGQTLYRDTNGEDPDFFIFEVGMNDNFTMQAILEGGELGEEVSVSSATYGATGLFTVLPESRFDNQQIGGLAFDITDLLISRDSAIEGIQINSNKIDPANFSAVLLSEPAEPNLPADVPEVVLPEPAEPNLPDNFPSITAEIYDSNAIGEGYIFLAVAAEVEGVGYYLMILENDGTPVWYKELPDDYSYDFKVQPNGLLTYAQFLHHHTYSGGGDVLHIVMDQDYNEIENIQMGNGYIAEAHDFQLLSNGHVLLFGYYMTQMDLSGFVNGGYPNALVSGGIVQELDDDRNVIFQWRTWDYHSPEEHSWGRRSSGPIVSAFHLNTINMDIDGHIIIATPVEVTKINRQTGEIIWHLGGDENEFTVIGIDPEEADGHFGGHTFHRIPNGNFLVFDNGNRTGTRNSQVHEYKLDEENKTAEHVWTYIPDTTIPSWHRGSVQRLPNGNTFIGWGGASGKPIPACTEVTPDGEKVFEMFFDNPEVESYRAFRFQLSSDVPGLQLSKILVSEGDHDFVYGDIDTGVSIKIRSLTGSGYNSLAVLRMPYAPMYPEFEGTAPTILPFYVLVGGHNIGSIDGQISLDVESFNLKDPENLTIYYRESVAQGVFTPLETSYNWATNKLRADITGYGEFVIGKPDLEHIALAPILIAPEPDGTVNEELPIAFEWTPRGFVNSYHLQVATDPEFNALVVDDSDIKETPYILETVEADTIYYWQVSTINDAGPSEWSQASFTTVPPMIQVTVPNGGEQWQRGIEYFIQWDDNLAEDVVIELYKGETLLQTIDTVPSNGAYKWEADLELEAGGDYSIIVKSAVDDTLSDASDAVFTFE